MENQTIHIVDDILAEVRTQVVGFLGFLDRRPESYLMLENLLNISLEGLQSNGKAAARMYRTGGQPHFRLHDGARDAVLALACLKLDDPKRFNQVDAESFQPKGDDGLVAQ